MHIIIVLYIVHIVRYTTTLISTISQFGFTLVQYTVSIGSTDLVDRNWSKMTIIKHISIDLNFDSTRVVSGELIPKLDHCYQI